MKIGAQLYTLREFTTTAAGFEDVLARVAQMGYHGVQISAVGCMNGPSPEVTPERAKEMLDRHGLSAAATHRGWDGFAQDLQSEVAFHKALGCTYTAIGWLPNEFERTDAGFRRWLHLAVPVAKALKEAGIRFGYHNHDFEFVRTGPNRRTAYDVFIEEGAPDLELEIDTYWAQSGGFDPATLLRRAAGRIWVVHLKDWEIIVGEGHEMAPVGEGSLDWPGILDACRTGGTEWLLVEQDVCRRDPFDCLQSSIDFLKGQL